MTRLNLHKTRISDLRVLACGIALEQYPRDDTLWRGLSRLDIDKLIDLRRIQNYVDHYQDRLNKDTQISEHTFHRITKTICSINSFLKYMLSILQTVRNEQIDVVFIFPRNHNLAICLGLLRFLHRAKIYFDIQTSRYSSAVSNVLGRFTISKYWITEFLSILLADRLICLTPEYGGYFQKVYKASPAKFHAVRDGVQDIWFEEPVNTEHISNSEAHRPKRAIYWGTFLIQHGIDLIICAAREMEDEDIQFILYGGGEREAYVREEVQRNNMKNLIFKGYIPTTRELIRLVDNADITFGILNDIHDTRLATSNKTQQGMARSKPVITLWTKQKEDMYLTQDNPFPPLIMIEKPDPKLLVAAIREIIKDPLKARKIGHMAKLTVRKLHSIEAVTSDLRGSFEEAVK